MIGYWLRFIGWVTVGGMTLTMLALIVGKMFILPNNELVFTAYLNNGVGGIYRMDIAHGLIQLLTSDTDTRTAPIWSPDGQQIAFVHYFGNRSSIEVIDVQGKNVRQMVAPDNYVYAPAWSPDGRYLVYVNSDEASIPELMMKDLASGIVSRLTDKQEGEITPAWSPDSRHVIFDSDMTTLGNLDVFIWDMETKAVHPLIATPANDTNAIWSPDGHYLMYIARENNNQNMVLYDTRDGQSTVLFAGIFSDFDTPDWSPDGRYIVYAGFKSPASIGMNVFRVDIAACLQQPQTCSPEMLTLIPNTYLSPHWRPNVP